MTFRLRVHGAAGRVTGSLYLVEVDGHRILLECGLIQGSREDESHNDAAADDPPEPAEDATEVELRKRAPGG